MGKCQHCNIEILDETERCPLCQTVLEHTEELENMYPNIRTKMQKLLFACRLYLFCAIVLEGALVAINLLTESGTLWCIISGLTLLMGYITLRFGVISKAGYRSKFILLTMAAVLCAIGIDFVIGYRGWSLDFAIPSGILVVDVVIIVCMIFNRRNWQSYIMWQLLMILFSLIPPALFLTGLERNPYTAFLPLALSSAIFLGTMIIGDHRAVVELKRRFHFR